MTQPLRRHVVRGAGFFLISVFTGLVAYQSPPSSWSEFGAWVWQPAMQGILAALTSMGLTAATEDTQ
jgi:hypothetical protein